MGSREAATTLGEIAHQWVGATDRFSEPREVIPDGEVVYELVRRVGDPLGCRERLGDRREFEIWAEALDHLLTLRTQAGAHQLEARGRLGRYGVGTQKVQHRIG